MRQENRALQEMVTESARKTDKPSDQKVKIQELT